MFSTEHFSDEQDRQAKYEEAGLAPSPGVFGGGDHRYEPFDTFIAAVEGGINYWARIRSRSYPTDLDAPKTNDWFVTVQDREDENEPTYRIDYETIQQGLRRLRDGTVTWGSRQWSPAVQQRLYNSEISGDGDADSADNIVQAGLFGDIVYG